MITSVILYPQTSGRAEPLADQHIKPITFSKEAYAKTNY